MSKKSTAKSVSVGTREVAKFKVATLAESKKYAPYADIINALFPKDYEISYDEADKAIEEYLGRRV